MLTVAALLAATLTLTERRAVTLASSIVRVGDVASGAGPMARAAIARLPRGRSEVVLTRRAIGSLIRRAIPGVTVAGDGGVGAISFATSIDEPHVATCLVARSPINTRSAVLSDQVVSAPCEGRAALGLASYDRARGEVVARRAIEAGANLGMMRLPEPSAVHAGDHLTLISRAGPVTVERAVTAMQPGRNGHRIFVRDGAGKVSSIAFAAAVQ
jgi:hypothetical protein